MPNRELTAIIVGVAISKNSILEIKKNVIVMWDQWKQTVHYLVKEIKGPAFVFDSQTDLQ